MVGLIATAVLKMVNMGIKGQTARFEAQERWDKEHANDVYKSKLLLKDVKEKEIKDIERKINKERIILGYGIIGTLAFFTITGILIYKNKI